MFCFNSIKVRLELILRGREQATIEGFNSIKVRLEHLKTHLPDLENLFQFHKGTIRTSEP